MGSSGTPTHCPYCALQCGMNLAPGAGGTVEVRERADFPVNRGVLCGKGRTAPTVLSPSVRPASPLVRSAGGALVPASWEEALERVAEGLGRTRAEYGADAAVVSRRGRAVAPARITAAIRPDTVFMPFHWAGEGRANTLTHPALDPASRMPEFKVCAVRVEAVAP
ncbi:molybdopterin dinucleotide binding domain-containing protein [Streptomyces sp. NPDC058442]|uniref:molybdopterin dinucleotide binding domain-containing protein n=1 Tax=Streptomyces sp. NPDC058442 TaxID=3346503 RepID=UPI0036501B6E